MRVATAALRRRPTMLIALTALLLAAGASAPLPLAAAGAPAIVIASPPGGARLSSPAEARFAARAHDPAVGGADGAGIAAVEFELVGAGFASRERHAAYCAFGGDDGCAPMPQELFDQLAGGSYVLRARAVADSGAISAWASSDFTLGAAAPPAPAPSPTTPAAPGAPTVAWLHPPADATIARRADTAFAARAHDPAVGGADGDGVSRVEFELVGAGATAVERYPAYCMFGGDEGCRPMPADRFDALPDGRYTLRARAVGHSGVASAWLARSFTLARGATPVPTAHPTVPPAPTSPPQPTPPPGGPILSGSQWQPLAIRLQAERDYGERAAYRDVAVTARFTQGARSMTVPGFWDGGADWIVRWTPPAAGEWDFTIDSSAGDPGLRQSGRVSVNPSARRGFLRVDSATESFVYDSGERPYLVGTTYYELVKQARAGGQSWLAAFGRIRVHGIGKVRMLVYPWATNPEKPSGYPDSQPFHPGDHDTLDLAHWRALDRVAEVGLAEGLVIDMVLFTDSARAFGTREQDERYLRYALARYAAYPNVIWTLTNEWSLTGKGAGYWDAMGVLMRAEDPWMSEGGRLRPLSIHQGGGERFAFADAAWPSHAVVQLNHRAGYPHGDQWGARSILANAGRGRPVVNDEIGYYTQSKDGIVVDRANARRALWAIAASGGYGTTGDASLVRGGLVYKSGDWHDVGGLYDDIQRLTAAVQGLPRWWEYRAQPGAARDGQRVYVAGAGGLGYLVYAADGGRVELSLAAGSYRLTQLDPRTGERAGLGLATQNVTWSPPAGQDWALLIERAG